MRTQSVSCIQSELCLAQPQRQCISCKLHSPLCIREHTTSASLSQTQHWPAPLPQLSLSPSPTSAEQYSTLKNASCHQVQSLLPYCMSKDLLLSFSNHYLQEMQKTKAPRGCIGFSIEICARPAQHLTVHLTRWLACSSDRHAFCLVQQKSFGNRSVLTSAHPCSAQASQSSREAAQGKRQAWWQSSTVPSCYHGGLKRRKQMGSGEEENLLVSTHPPLWIQDAPIARCSPSSLPAQGGEERGDREKESSDLNLQHASKAPLTLRKRDFLSFYLKKKWWERYKAEAGQSCWSSGGINSERHGDEKDEDGW